MKFAKLAFTPLLMMIAAPLAAAEISTHVLDLESGVGGEDVPVVLMQKSEGGGWQKMGEAKTDEKGRIKSFGEGTVFAAGTYKLVFDMTGYHPDRPAAFFPEINLIFNVTDADAHYHVPVVVSPYGYSTYRGN